MSAKSARLLEVLARREQWRDELEQVERLHKYVHNAERILSGDMLKTEGQAVTNATVGVQFDEWCEQLRADLAEDSRSSTERACLKHFVQVTTNMRSRLIRCYDLKGMPRTNNDMEGFIRLVKTRYRRVSGRKNWNRYLIRYGARVAFYEARARTGELEMVRASLRGVGSARWRQGRREQTTRQQEQLKQYRVRHRREAYLADLEARWAALAPRT